MVYLIQRRVAALNDNLKSVSYMNDKSDDTCPGESFEMSDLTITHFMISYKRLLNLTLRTCECLPEKV